MGDKTREYITDKNNLFIGDEVRWCEENLSKIIASMGDKTTKLSEIYQNRVKITANMQK